MSKSGLIQARIEEDIKEAATAVLRRVGLSISDVMRIVVTRTAKEGAVPPGLLVDEAAYDAWFKERVRKAMESTAPRIPNEDVSAHFAQRRAAAQAGRS